MMLTVAFFVLLAAVLLGTTLAVLYLRPAAPPPPWPLAVLHGLVGIGGLACLAVSLGGPPRGLDQGTASFGAISAVLLGLAALVGIGVVLMHRVKRRRAGTLVGVHATLAVSGFVILAAYLLA
jgi:hypothetical protein